MKGYLISTNKVPQQVEIDVPYYIKRQNINHQSVKYKIVKINNNSLKFNIIVFGILGLFLDNRKSIYGDYLIFDPKNDLTEHEFEKLLQIAFNDDTLLINELKLLTL